MPSGGSGDGAGGSRGGPGAARGPLIHVNTRCDVARRVRGEVRRPRLGGGAGASRLGRAADRHRGAIRDPPQGSIGGDARPLSGHGSQAGAFRSPRRWRASDAAAGAAAGDGRGERQRASPVARAPAGGRSGCDPGDAVGADRRLGAPARGDGAAAVPRAPPAPGLRTRRDDDRDESARARGGEPGCRDARERAGGDAPAPARGDANSGGALHPAGQPAQRAGRDRPGVLHRQHAVGVGRRGRDAGTGGGRRR